MINPSSSNISHRSHFSGFSSLFLFPSKDSSCSSFFSLNLMPKIILQMNEAGIWFPVFTVCTAAYRVCYIPYSEQDVVDSCSTAFYYNLQIFFQLNPACVWVIIPPDSLLIILEFRSLQSNTILQNDGSLYNLCNILRLNRHILNSIYPTYSYKFINIYKYIYVNID